MNDSYKRYSNAFLNELYMEYAYCGGSFEGKEELLKKTNEFNNEYQKAYQEEAQERQDALQEQLRQQEAMQRYQPVNYEYQAQGQGQYQG